MLDPSYIDSMALLALQILAWSNIGVATAMLLVLVAALACVTFDCLRDRRVARGRGTLGWAGPIAGREA